MLRESHVAVVARNEAWSGAVATEPYEAGWASEAVIFVRALKVENLGAGCDARVQISPDGIRWVDEGTRFTLPAAVDAVTFARVTQFGNWLRIAATLPVGARLSAVVTFHLK
jgi:hypothetical protein